MAKIDKKTPLTWITVKRKVKQLLPLTFNPRKISEQQIEKLKKSLEKFNLAEIPIVNFDNKIIGGNQRVKALQLLGRGSELIDVRYPSRQLSESELKEYMLTSNTHAGEWDFDILELEFSDLNLEDFNIELPELGSDFNDENSNQTRPGSQKHPDDTVKWIVYIDCKNEKEAEIMYNEMAKRGFETKIVN